MYGQEAVWTHMAKLKVQQLCNCNCELLVQNYTTTGKSFVECLKVKLHVGN